MAEGSGSAVCWCALTRFAVWWAQERKGESARFSSALVDLRGERLLPLAQPVRAVERTYEAKTSCYSAKEMWFVPLFFRFRFPPHLLSLHRSVSIARD